MYDTKAIIQSAFSSSLSDLSSQYEILASLNSEDRNNYVSVANEYSLETEKMVNSDETKKAIVTLLQFQFLSRFKRKIHGDDNWRGANGHSMSHMVDSFKHVCNMARTKEGVWEKFNNFVYKTPSLEEFLRISFLGMAGADFYTQVEFVSNDLYGISFPSSSSMQFKDWISSARLSDEQWDWEYRNKIEEWNKRWFKSKSSLIEINKEWSERKENIISFLEEVRPIFSELHDCNQRLNSLKTRQLQSSIGLEAVNKAYAAITEGVKLKHLLLEEGHELAKAWNKIGRGL